MPCDYVIVFIMKSNVPISDLLSPSARNRYSQNQRNYKLLAGKMTDKWMSPVIVGLFHVMNLIKSLSLYDAFIEFFLIHGQLCSMKDKLINQW